MDTIAEMTLAPTECFYSLSDVASAELPRVPGVHWKTAEAGTRLEMSGPMQEVLACVHSVRHALRQYGLVASSTRVRRVQAQPAAPSRSADRTQPRIAERPLSMPMPAVA